MCSGRRYAQRWPRGWRSASTTAPSSAGECALGWLGDRMPHTRSLILTAIAGALRDAGRLEEASTHSRDRRSSSGKAFNELSSCS